MDQTHSISNIPGGSRIILVALVPAKGDEGALIIAAAAKEIAAGGATIVGTLIQRRGISRSRKPGGAQRFQSAIDSATYIGRGKVTELSKLVSRLQANAVVFCNPLSRTQQRNVEEVIGVPVVSLDGG